MRTLNLGYSPCPNDTYIFYALTHGRIATPGFSVATRLEDVETLNRLAMNGQLDLTKISYHAFGHLRDRYVLLRSGGALPIIGVGGIFNVDDAWEKITAGAGLIQLYTGFIYEGPTLPKQIVAGLKARLALHGFDHLAQAVGLNAHPSDDVAEAPFAVGIS